MWANIFAAVAAIVPAIVELASKGEPGTVTAIGAAVGSGVAVANRVIQKRKAGAPVFRTKP